MKKIILANLVGLIFLSYPSTVLSYTTLPEVEKPPVKLSVKEYAFVQVTEAWNREEWEAFETIIQKESNWNVYGAHYPNTKKSSATGLCGLLNASWPEGFTKTHDPYVQVDACIAYIKFRYSTPQKALAFHKRIGWF